jgi:hypothetical protein
LDNASLLHPLVDRCAGHVSDTHGKQKDNAQYCFYSVVLEYSNGIHIEPTRPQKS